MNQIIRYNACCLFLPFYPILHEDDFVRFFKIIFILFASGTIKRIKFGRFSENYRLKEDLGFRTIFWKSNSNFEFFKFLNLFL